MCMRVCERRGRDGAFIKIPILHASKNTLLKVFFFFKEEEEATTAS